MSSARSNYILSVPFLIFILKLCNLPLTAKNQVNLIVTEMGVMEVRNDGLHLIEYNNTFTLDEIIKSTDANLIINNPKAMEME